MGSSNSTKKGLAGNGLFQLTVVVITFLLVVTAIGIVSPPKPKPVNAPANEFSAARAFKHTKAICKKPRMIGTEENKRVSEYLAGELKRVGLEVDTQKTTSYNFEDVPIFGTITNVVGRLRGTSSSKAVLVLGHYDSQPYSLGAADDGIALASMLESAEVLKNHYSFKNDIIFLFTDAEEVGLLGAIAFAKEHPWVNDVGLVLNVEARGTRGTALSFEVSPDNGWIMKEFIKNVEYPYAGSMMYEVYKMMPNYTDFTIFKDKGISGFNIAIVEGYENYHSPTDKPENLSLASLQHMGSYIISIANHFGNISLENTKGDDLVYFNALGSKMVYYPLSWNTVIFIAIIILFLFYIYLGFGRRELGLLKILVSFITCLAAMAAAVFTVILLNNLVKELYPHYKVFYMSNFYNVKHYFFAYIGLTVAISSFLFYLLMRRVNIYNIMFSVFLIFIALSVVILIKIPTATYLTYIPLVFGLLAFDIILLFSFSAERKPLVYYALLFVGATPYIFVISLYFYLIFFIFGLSLPLAGVAILMLLLLILLPLLEGALKRFNLLIPTVSLLIALIFLVIAHFKSGYTEEKPLQSNVMYASLIDEEKAFWLSSFTHTDEWNKQFFNNSVEDSIPEIYPARKKIYLKNEAIFRDFAKPEVSVITDSTSNGYRYLELNLKSLIESGSFELLIPNSYRLKCFAVNGNQAYGLERLANRKEGYLFRIFNNNVEGVKIILEYEGEQPLSFSVIEKKIGLPNFDNIKPMPVNIIKGVGYESHITLVKSKLEI